MSEERTVNATFSDFRIVKGRKVFQMFMEVPLEQMMSVLNTLGQPSIEDDKWCKITLLEDRQEMFPHAQKAQDNISANDSEPPQKDEGAYLVKQCALCCQDARFQMYLRACGYHVEDESDAAFVVRQRLAINSRSEIKSNQTAAAGWKLFHATYKTWETDLNWKESRRP